MSIDFDKTETEVIMKKLCGDIPEKSSHISDGTNRIMADALYKMNITAVNRSYREITAETTAEKITRLFKRLIRRLTFWFVEPCMIQQTEYNSANNIFSSETNNEISDIKNKLENVENLSKSIKELTREIDGLKKQLDEMKKNTVTAKENEIKEIKISYSQSGEDNIIRYILSTLRRNIRDITYLDLGANHAVHLSNTYGFYSEGARGILLEANPELARELAEQRPEDIVINKCLTEKPCGNTDFYILNGDGLSSSDLNAVMGFIKENPELKIEKTVSVESVTINEITEKYFPEKAPDIMNIDIEGMELAIMKMTDFEKFRPLIIICEMIGYKNGLTVGEKNQEIIDIMEKNGYTEFAFTGINSIFTDSRITGGGKA
ncbi:MAG: FkbM family methyltransferase [Ruminococcus sp.]|nr:FkbM family methyltransferase [Ruminococcus sp.]